MENQDEKKAFKEKVDPQESQLSDDAIWFGLAQSPADKQCNAGHYTGTEKGQRDKNLVVME